MGVRLFVDSILIPDDGCLNVIHDFEEHTKCNIYVYPDVHLKKNSRMSNGTLVYSEDSIFLSCLGVENCGFTFGSIECDSKNELVKSFNAYSEILKTRVSLPQYSSNEIREQFETKLVEDFLENLYLYDFLGLDKKEDVLEKSRTVINDEIIDRAARYLNTLGGGNHFFEIHQIADSQSDERWLQKGKFIFMIHSDSINVGDYVFNLYSDLFEMRHNNKSSLKGIIATGLFRIKRNKYFKRIGLDKKENRIELGKLNDALNVYKEISAKGEVGKELIFAHHIASLFGDMNRIAIIENWSKSQGIKCKIMGNQSHDMLSVEEHNGKRMIVHRNGVQKVGKCEYCILPGAMGSTSFILRNPKNNEAFFSTNHGVGRNQDKHIARGIYNEPDTCMELKNKNITLFKIRNGNMAEQNMKAFKDPNLVLEQMQKHGLATVLAKTFPVAILKE